MTRGRGNSGHRRRRVPLHPSTSGTFQPIKEPAVISGSDCKANGSVEKGGFAADDHSQDAPHAGNQCPQEEPPISKRDGNGRRPPQGHISKPCSHHHHHPYHQHQQTWEGKESSDPCKTPAKYQNGDGKASPRSQEYTPYMAARAKELKEEGNRLFQRKDYTSAMDQYELALKLTPPEHPDRAIFHSNRAACLMQMKPVQYDAAIRECNLALHAQPGFPRALLRRARAFEATGKLELALQDVEMLLQADVSHPDAHNMAQRIRTSMQNGGDAALNDNQGMPSTPVAPPREKTCAGASMDAVSSNLRALSLDALPVRKEGEEFNTCEEDDNGNVITPCASLCHMQTPPHSFSQQTRTCLGEISSNTPSKEVSEETPRFNSSGSSNPLPQTPPGESCKSESLKKVIHQDNIQILQIHDKIASHRPVKLIYDHDIRLAEMPVNCKFGDLRKLVRERFPSSKAVLIKYKDAEGDLVTITSTHDLRLAEAAASSDAASRSFRMANMGVSSSDQHKNSAIGLPVVPSMLDQLRLHVVEVSPDQEPYDKEETATVNGEGGMGNTEAPDNNGSVEERAQTCGKEELDKWLQDFAQLFRAHLGIDPNGHIDLHERGMELCAQALEEVASTEEAHRLFDLAVSKFQEMVALGFLNWGNVYMCAARKQVPHDSDDDSQLDFCDKLQAAFDWAQTQYALAEEKFEQSIGVKPDFCDALLSLGHKVFESAKLHWSLAIAKQTDLSTWDSSEMLKLFCKAEKTMQEAAEMLEKQESGMEDVKPSAGMKHEMENADEAHRGDGVHKKFSTFEQDVALKSQVYLFWGNILYEHSQVEFRLGLLSWKDHLDAAVQKFEVGGASSVDITTAIENHLSSSAIFSDATQNIAQQDSLVPTVEIDSDFNGSTQQESDCTRAEIDGDFNGNTQQESDGNLNDSAQQESYGPSAVRGGDFNACGHDSVKKDDGNGNENCVPMDGATEDVKKNEEGLG